MRTRFIMLLLSIHSVGFCQKIGKYYDYQWHGCKSEDARFYSTMVKTDSGWHRIDYFIRGLSVQMEGWYEDSVCKIANGSFIYAYPNKKVEMYGRYLHGKKQGLWLTFTPMGTSQIPVYMIKAMRWKLELDGIIMDTLPIHLYTDPMAVVCK